MVGECQALVKLTGKNVIVSQDPSDKKKNKNKGEE